MRARREWLGRLLVEFAVIVLGVLVALAADRWLVRVDEEAAAQLYYAQLESDLLGDSALLERKIAEAGQGTEMALALLELAAGVATFDDLPPSFRGSVSGLAVGWAITASYSPFEVRQGTWDDLISTGRMSLVGADIRTALSNYYDGIRALRGTEEEWQRGLNRFHDGSAMAVEDPLDRLALISELADLGNISLPERLEGQRYTRTKSYEELLREVVTALRENRELHAALADVRWIQSVVAERYRARLDETLDVLSKVRAASAL